MVIMMAPYSGPLRTAGGAAAVGAGVTVGAPECDSCWPADKVFGDSGNLLSDAKLNHRIDAGQIFQS